MNTNIIMNFGITEKLVSTVEAMERITPGMNIFLGTGVAEPRTLIKALLPFDDLPSGNPEPGGKLVR